MVAGWRVQPASTGGLVQEAAQEGHGLYGCAGGMGGGLANSCQAAAGGSGSALVGHALSGFEEQACTGVEAASRKVVAAAVGAKKAVLAIQAGDAEMAATASSNAAVVDSVRPSLTSDNGVTLGGEDLGRTLRFNP